MRFRSTALALAALALPAATLSAQCDLTTIFAQNNGLGVNSVCYFDLNATAGFRVTGLSVNTTAAAGLPANIEIYTIPGTYTGNTASSAGWILQSAGSGTTAGTNVPTFCPLATPFVVTPGSYGVCVRYVDIANSYTNGTGANQAYSNAFYSLTLGESAGSAFTGGTITPRVWNGTIHCTPASGLYASFSATPTSGATPLNATFTDTSFTSAPGGVTSWAWDLDGDSIVDSNAANPSFTYTTCGRYDVTLTVNDGVNPQSSITRNDYIVADPQLLVNASFSSAPSGPLAFQFTDTSAGSPTQWSWDFDGDNIPDSALQNPSWTYGTGGLYTVTLTASNACGGGTVSNQVNVIANDDCTGAIPVGQGRNGPFSNVGAASSGSFTCGGTTDSDVWFRYTSGCNATLEINTCGTAPTWDTKISVHTGQCGALTQIACNDDAGAGCGASTLLSRVTGVPVSAGQTIYIAMGGYVGRQGVFVFDIISTTAGTGTFATQFPACGGANLATTGLPNIGSPISFTMTPATGVAFFMIGSVPLGVPLCPQGCIIGHNMDVVLPGPTFSATIPCWAFLRGGQAYFQGLELGVAGGCPSGNPVQLVTTQTIVATIG
ncbi:MAG: PKD domain-containing protein [Planctomycetes bacterium]|nr:PKD domain-containing protein [Planctomycetota bacterium]